MSDEVENAPGESTEPPTVAEPAADEPAVAETKDPASEPSTKRPGVVIPRWVAILVGALIVVLGSGAIGYAIGHDAGSGDHGRVEIGRGYRGGPKGPFGPNGRNGPNGQFGPNGQGGGQLPGGGSNTAPSTPSAPTANGAFLGVSVQADTGGVRITGVASGSPAEDAGLKSGDVVTAIDGKSVGTPAELVTQVQAHSSGDQVTITYTRNGSSATAKVTLGSRADSGTRS